MTIPTIVDAQLATQGIGALKKYHYHPILADHTLDAFRYVCMYQANQKKLTSWQRMKRYLKQAWNRFIYSLLID